MSANCSADVEKHPIPDARHRFLALLAGNWKTDPEFHAVARALQSDDGECKDSYACNLAGLPPGSSYHEVAEALHASLHQD